MTFVTPNTKLSVTVIKPSHPLNLNLAELWQYRELFFILSWRDIKVRYKQTFLGIAWAIFQPLVTMLIFTFFFGKLAGIPSGNLPYPLFVLIGLTVWSFFSSALTNSSNSLVDQEHIIKKVYFPRLIVPLATIITAAVDFFIVLGFLVLVILFYHQSPHPLLLPLAPLFLLIVFLTVSGIGLFLSSINVKYRDVRYILPFFIQLLMFLTPVIYPTSILAERHKWILVLNPLSGIIESTRLLISGNSGIQWGTVMLSLTLSVVIFTLGLLYFKKTESFIADII